MHFAPKIILFIVSESGVDNPESQHTEELHHPTIINTAATAAEQLAKDSQAATEDLPIDDSETSHDHLAKASQTDPLVESTGSSRAAGASPAASNNAVKAAAAAESKQHSSCHQSSPVHQYRYTLLFLKRLFNCLTIMETFIGF